MKTASDFSEWHPHHWDGTWEAFDAFVREIQSDAYAQGYSDALEAAAKVCDQYENDYHDGEVLPIAPELAKKIRALAPGGASEGA